MRFRVVATFVLLCSVALMAQTKPAPRGAAAGKEVAQDDPCKKPLQAYVPPKSEQLPKTSSSGRRSGGTADSSGKSDNIDKSPSIGSSESIQRANTAALRSLEALTRADPNWIKQYRTA